MSIPINVWYYNEVLSNWTLKGTQDLQETKDEYKYFRVISEGKKYFYSSSNDYIKHNKNIIRFKDCEEVLTDINNQTISYEL